MRLAPLPLPHSLAAHAAAPPHAHNWPMQAAAEAGSTTDAFGGASVILADGTLDTLSAVAGAGATVALTATGVALLVAVGALGSWLPSRTTATSSCSSLPGTNARARKLEDSPLIAARFWRRIFKWGAANSSGEEGEESSEST